MHGAAGRGSSSDRYGSVGRRAASALLFGMPKHPAPPRPRHWTCYQRLWRLQWGGPGMRAARCRPLGDSLEAMPAAGRFAWSERHQQTYRCPGAPSRIAPNSGRGCCRPRAVHAGSGCRQHGSVGRQPAFGGSWRRLSLCLPAGFFCAAVPGRSLRRTQCYLVAPTLLSVVRPTSEA